MTPQLPSDSPKKKQQNEGTYLALIFVIGCVIGLISFTSLVLPQISGLLFVGVGFCGFVALHYFTWGRWLIRRVEQQAREEK